MSLQRVIQLLFVCCFNTRNLTATSFQPIPMTPFYYNSSLSNLPDATRDIVFKAVDKAIQRIVELSK
ncbi:hypothetical protein GQ600_10740 [Phytophthora cactorum]|nr:hypothetical protein GQ600_10740 [Phytophthora cactorum]